MSDNVDSPLHLLSLDDGGIKALTTLFIIKEMMHRLQGNLEHGGANNSHPAQLPKPCDYFDMIAGIGTGAICAIMLGRLRMGIDEAIQSYMNLMENVFSHPKTVNRGTGAFKSSLLEKELKRLIERKAGREDEMLLEEANDSSERRCKVVVYAMSAYNMAEPVPFRSYVSSNGAPTRCTIWEALRATTSHSEMFKPIDLDLEGVGVKNRFAHGGLGCSNPTEVLFEEASRLYTGTSRVVASIVSIGSGHPQVIQIAGGRSSKSTAERVREAARRMAEGSEQAAERMAKRFQADVPKYYRLNVQQGLQQVDASEWERMDEVAAQARAYLKGNEISAKLNRLVGKLLERPAPARAARAIEAPRPIPEQSAPNHARPEAPRPRQNLTDRSDTRRPDLARFTTSMLLALRLKRDAPPTNVPPPPTPAKLPTPVPSTRSRERMSIADLPTPSTHNDPFAVLAGRLRNALGSRKGVVWDSEPGRRFHVVLVDKNVTLPPRKVQLPPTGQASQIPLPPRSPLSPLTPSSPLFPDGLIAPIWIRKHIELVPSVFVLFMRLWEAPAPKSPLEPRIESEEEEKQRDNELAMEIATRKRSTSERGIKLTVVLLASRRALDDPALDARLSFIRRQGGLDSRAALFVLSPVSSSELNEFVGSLQDALHESALEYYVAHSKRVRRKRNRHNHGSTVPTPHLSAGSGSGRPLGPQGWAVRYEYKMATFAEFRDEQEVARKHYEDCWAALVDMFGSTALLPPRTKRWAEAKVLADCITVKICKLYLYHNLTNRALSHFNRHLHRFAELSRGWGIGDETYEFWSWMARQHRIFAELLEHGLRSGLQINSLAPPPLPHSLPSQPPSSSIGHASKASISPSPTPAPSQFQPGLSLPTPGAGVNAALSSGLNPALVLQHPGFYYYIAAGCSRERLIRFKAVLEAETRDPSPVSATPAFANEKKIDHHSLIVELYTKAYETFKQQKAGQTRLTYYIAYRIAETHYESGKFDLAVKFFERIARTYRTERWTKLLRPALALWYDCARQLADIDLSLRVLAEMLVPGMTNDEERMNIGEDLMAILKSTAPSSGTTPIAVDLSDHEPLFHIVPTFWQATSPVNEYVPFQIVIKGPDDGALAQIEFSSLDVKFTGVDRVLTIYHAKDGAPAEGYLQMIQVGSVESEITEGEEKVAWLRWDKNNTIVLCGNVMSSRGEEVKVESVTFRIKEGEWTLEFPFRLQEKNDSEQRLWYGAKRIVALRGSGSTMVNFISPPLKVELSIQHSGKAYIGEHYPIEVTVRNADSRALYVSLDVLVQPAVDDSQNDITIGDETSSSLIKQVSLGLIQPEDHSTKTLILFTRGSPGDRVLDFSVRSGVVSSRAPSPSASPQRTAIPLSPTNDKLLSPTSPTYEDKAFLPSSKDLPAESDKETTETLHMLTVPTVLPFSNSTSVVYERPQKPHPGLLDPETFTPGYAEPRNLAVVNFGLTMDGDSDIIVQDIQFELKENSPHSLIDSTLDTLRDVFPMEWAKGDSFATSLRIQTHAEDRLDDFLPGTEAKPAPGTFSVHWKRVGVKADLPASTSTITLPALKEPDDELIARAHLPPFAKLHESFSLHLTIENCGQTRTADIGLTLETTESFVCAGPRVLQIPALLPGTSTDVYLDVVALSVGYIKLPRVRVHDRREETPRDVPTIAAGWDARGENGEGMVVTVTGEDGQSTRASAREGMYLLVRPD